MFALWTKRHIVYKQSQHDQHIPDSLRNIHPLSGNGDPQNTRRKRIHGGEHSGGFRRYIFLTHGLERKTKAAAHQHKHHQHSPLLTCFRNRKRSGDQ